MALVKLVDLDGLVPLRTRRDEEYFQMTVPQVDSLIKYYRFNDDNYFKGDFVLYKVVSVTQELQESWNGSYEERFEVRVVKISD
jgi:hypothetical protein